MGQWGGEGRKGGKGGWEGSPLPVEQGSVLHVKDEVCHICASATHIKEGVLYYRFECLPLVCILSSNDETCPHPENLISSFCVLL